MKRQTLLFSLSGLYFVMLASCFKVSNIVTKYQPAPTGVSSSDDSDSLWLTLSSSNLSEDMSFLASNNDEIHLLMYYYSAMDETLGDLFYSMNTVFDENHTSSTHYIGSRSAIENSYFLTFLIEEDDNTSTSTLDGIIKANWKQIMEDYRNTQYSNIKKYLGNDDVLGAHVLRFTSSNELNQLTIRGLHKTDRYVYNILLGGRP